MKREELKIKDEENEDEYAADYEGIHECMPILFTFIKGAGGGKS